MTLRKHYATEEYVAQQLARWDFERTVSGVTPAIDQHLATKGYVDAVAAALNIFLTVNCPNGTDPVAGGPTDTLNLVTAQDSIYINGLAPTDSVSFDLDINSVTAGATPVAGDEFIYQLAGDGLLRKATLAEVNAVIDHGDLAGTGDAADHTWALLVDGTRALAGPWDMGAQVLTNIGEMTLADGSSINLQEAITFAGATGENLIEIPDHLAEALVVKEGANSYLTFVTTNAAEAITLHKNVTASIDMTVTGVLYGDTITERTGGAGVTAEGVLFIDNRIQLDNTATSWFGLDEVGMGKYEVGGKAILFFESPYDINFLAASEDGAAPSNRVNFYHGVHADGAAIAAANLMFFAEPATLGAQEGGRLVIPGVLSDGAGFAWSAMAGAVDVALGRIQAATIGLDSDSSLRLDAGRLYWTTSAEAGVAGDPQIYYNANMYVECPGSMVFVLDDNNDGAADAFYWCADGVGVLGLIANHLMSLTDEGLLSIEVNGAGAGLELGDDVHLYRGAANVLYLADGDSLQVYEDITFAGATTENLIKFPDNLAIALDMAEGVNSYLTFVTTNGSEQITLGKKLAAGAVEIEGSAFDIDGGDISAVTISGDLTWSAAQSFGGQNLTNVGNLQATGNTMLGKNAAAATDLEVENTAGDAAPLVTLDQNDDDEAFINYEGTSAASAAKSISSWKSGATIQGYLRCEINGVVYWIAYHTAPTGV
jgi:hypothetical protein